MTHATFADRLRPSAGVSAFAYDVLLVAGGSVLIAVSAWCAVRLSISPVPITAQTFAVLLAGALLGWRRGSAAVVLYLLEGACGLPVFAGGAFGPLYMLGPTGGYLLGFLAAACLTGWLAERGWDRRWLTTAAAMTLGTAALFVPGVLWLSAFVGPGHAIGAGLVPFLPGAAIKIALATALLPAGWKLLGLRDGDGRR